jgi:hypothetical protein
MPYMRTVSVSIKGVGAGGGSIPVPLGPNRNLYLFDGSDTDFFDLDPDFTGNIKVIIAGTSNVGVHTDLLAGLSEAWRDTVDFNTPVWNFVDIDVTNLPTIVDTTFTGIIESYARDDVWYNVDEGVVNG